MRAGWGLLRRPAGRLLAVAMLLALVPLANASAGKHGRLQPSPRVRIVSPRSGEVVAGPDVEVVWRARGVRIVPAAEARRRGDQHAHLFLDRDVAPFLGSGLPIPRDDPKIVHTARQTVTFRDVAPGRHRLDLVLGYADHTAARPPAAAAVEFVVATPTVVPGTVEATIASFVYLPDPVVVPVGGTVRWTNLDADEHTVTADDRSWTSPVLGQGGSWSRTFTQRGTYRYFCEPHPFMRADVVVEER